MRAVVGVTDGAWATYLRDRPYLDEANFWLPSGTALKQLSPGEPFLFKTHWPDNRIVGGGFFSGWTRLRVSEAWDFFGEGNGVASRADLLSRIHHYRRSTAEPDPEIGCVLLRNLFFAVPGTELPGPPDFAKNLVLWKGYDLEAPEGRYVADAFAAMRSGARLDLAYGQELAMDDQTWAGGPTRGTPRLTVPRLGQQAFKGMVLTAYSRRCAVTGDKIRPVLEAAHIRPVAAEGQHRVDNGLLLRSDVHTLFDQGYLGVDERYRLQVSPRLRDEFGNGQEFYDRAGSEIALPDRRVDRPAREAVTWHLDTVFRR